MMWPKRISDVNRADIDEVISQERQEGSQLEFKSGISGAETSAAKRKLAVALVAFANTNGGTLILGIRDNEQDRACELQALPDCEGLAIRLLDYFPNVIDPPLLGLECHGISMSEDGAGVVVMRVPPSNAGPHWVKEERGSGGICYVRHQRSSRAIPMSGIHALVVERQQRMIQFENLFSDAKKDYGAVRKEMASTARGGKQVLSLCVAAAPLSTVSIGPLDTRSGLFDQREFAVWPSGSPTQHITLDGESHAWRPMLRGRALRSIHERHGLLLQDRMNGLVVTSIVLPFDPDDRIQGEQRFSPAPAKSLLPCFLATSYRAWKMRELAGDLSVPYAVRVSLEAQGNWFLQFENFSILASVARRYRIPSDREVIFPDYELTSLESFQDAFQSFQTDLWNLTGNAPPELFKVDWRQLLTGQLLD